MARTYPSCPVVGVGGLVLRGEEILLVKRLYPPGRGLWSVPGGHVKVGESLYNAAVRETLEETGIPTRPLGVVNVDDAIKVDERGVKYHYVLITVLLEPEDPSIEPRPSSDAADARYYRLQDALNLQLTKSTRGLIHKILRGQVPINKPIPANVYEPID